MTDAQLGSALLCVGLGALPTMAVTGRLVDRFGVRVAGVPLIALAATGVVMAACVSDVVSLSIGMLFVGATSGAADVAANALAGRAEARAGRRVITLAHAAFSGSVVLGSLGAGMLLSVSDAVGFTFLITGILIAVAGAGVFLFGAGPVSVDSAAPVGGRGRVPWMLPFALVGAVGALGFAVENAHQSWSAIFLDGELVASPFVAAVAPATFAAFAAVTRFAAGTLERIPARVLLQGGAIVAAFGTLLLASAQHVLVAVIGLALAAVGTSVLFPTLLSHTTRTVAEAERGRVTSIVSTIAYLGFVLGPVYVGVLAGAFGLRGSLIGVAALAVAFGILAPRVTGRTRATA